VINTIVQFLGNLGIDVSGVPDIVIAIGAIVVLIVGVRVLSSVANTILRIGCMVLVVAFIAAILLDVIR
jgi:hypothetical protein